MKPLLSWNRIPNTQPDQLITLQHASLPPGGNTPFTVYGNGRSYGDVCLTSHGSLIYTKHLDRFIQFDRIHGILRCEAGIQLADILPVIVPHGWFLPVTPGTRFITTGGAVANDVHGKNHHNSGSFGHHVTALGLIRSDHGYLHCSKQQNSAYFKATIGGLGLTGLISWVEFKLLPIKTEYMTCQAQQFSHIDEYWHLNNTSAHQNDYTVAWIDCLSRGRAQGRGILFSARHSDQQQPGKHHHEKFHSMPVTPPISLVNNLSLRIFNQLYYHWPRKTGTYISHYTPYFYPLDSIKHWNRMYGPEGFYQYQCVIPPEHATHAIKQLLRCISNSGQGSFLAVLKSFGTQPAAGMLSFTRPGTTLALDFPNRGHVTQNLFKQLDQIVFETGGALYPAKDARMPTTLFRSSFPQWQKFSEYTDPCFSSDFWRRMNP